MYQLRGGNTGIKARQGDTEIMGVVGILSTFHCSRFEYTKPSLGFGLLTEM
jgi:hypothetical protein